MSRSTMYMSIQVLIEIVKRVLKSQEFLVSWKWRKLLRDTCTDKLLVQLYRLITAAATELSHVSI